MDDIRRSFNEFLLNKARSATAYAATTEVLVNSLSHVENILLPGETGLNTAMTDFFNSMHELPPPRQTVLPAPCLFRPVKGWPKASARRHR